MTNPGDSYNGQPPDHLYSGINRDWPADDNTEEIDRLVDIALHRTAGMTDSDDRHNAVWELICDEIPDRGMQRFDWLEWVEAAMDGVL